MSGVKGKSGGKRQNSGRKRKDRTTSDDTKQNWLDSSAMIKKKTGMTMEDHACLMAIDPDIQASVRASIFKIRNEALIVRETKQDINIPDRTYGPVIGLPPILRPDPALEIVKGGKTK